MDFLRGLSLLVVVAWHWVFTVVWWHTDGPHAGNPIHTVPGGWALTWILQVMPVFFLVGGFAHLRAWESVERAGGGYRTFLARRLRRLLVPGLVCLGALGAVRLVAAAVAPHVGWVDRALFLVLSPLWFLGVYLAIAALAPLAVRAHRRWGASVPLVLLAAVATVDLLRFGAGVAWVGWTNVLFVWALVHQIGMSWEPLAAGGRPAALRCAAAGLTGLLVLTNVGLYSRSMVGVAGERVSNMGPPTLPIVALVLFQAGIALLARERVSAWLERPGPRRLTAWIGANAMTVYLWHFPAFAVAYALLSLAGVETPERATAAWWAQRPLWVAAPALCMLPLLRLLRRLERPASGGAPATG